MPFFFFSEPFIISVSCCCILAFCTLLILTFISILAFWGCKCGCFIHFNELVLLFYLRLKVVYSLILPQHPPPFSLLPFSFPKIIDSLKNRACMILSYFLLSRMWGKGLNIAIYNPTFPTFIQLYFVKSICLFEHIGEVCCARIDNQSELPGGISVGLL